MIAFDHINIQVKDQEAAKDFLIAVLGVEVGFRPPFDVPGYWLYLNDHAIIHMQAIAPNATQGESWVDHIAFGKFALDEQIAKLDKAGLTYHVGGIPGTGIRQIFIKGPEGLKVELQCHE